MHTFAMRLLVLTLLLGTCTPVTWGWAHHYQITRAALAVLPDADRWKALLGEQNFYAIANASNRPDQPRGDSGDYANDDYLLMRGLPDYISHLLPDLRQSYVPTFQRALVSLRTETPLNACRQLGSLIHYVEDSGAPPHAAAPISNHFELENWYNIEQVAIPGYTPQLLGKTDEEARENLLKRLDVLIAFSAERARRALPLIKQGEKERPNVEPIILESALESARFAADVLYTMFTLTLVDQPVGAGLEGTITSSPLTPNNAKGAKVVLLDNARFEMLERDAKLQARSATDYTTLAISAPQQTDPSGWQGNYTFRNLPAGTYRLLAYRSGSRWKISAPITLKVGETTRCDVALDPAAHVGNLLPNPDGTMRYLQEGKPDRWTHASSIEYGNIRFPNISWVSSKPALAPTTTYRCGAILKDPTAIVRFHITGHDPIALATGQPSPAEVRYTTSDGKPIAFVTVETARPFTDVIEDIWIIPEPVQ